MSKSKESVKIAIESAYRINLKVTEHFCNNIFLSKEQWFRLAKESVNEMRKINSSKETKTKWK